jgi:hypothetical protein
MRLAGTLLGLALAGGHATASAAPCPIDRGIARPARALAAADPDARLGFVRARIDAAAKPSRQWALGWGIGLGLLTIAQLGASAIVPREDAPDFWLGAVQSGIGAGSRAVFIPQVLIERRRMRRRAPTGDTCADLAAVERILVRSAKWEQRGRALWQHALSIAVNAAVGVALGVGFDRPVAGARLGTIGATGGAIMIITQPVPMTRALDRYRAGDVMASWGLRPLTLRGGGGIAFGGGL